MHMMYRIHAVVVVLIVVVKHLAAVKLYTSRPTMKRNVA
jgi:hypothetical protein